MTRSPKFFLRPVILAAVLLATACSDSDGPTATSVPDVPNPTQPTFFPEGGTPAVGTAQMRIVGYVEEVDPFRGTLTLSGKVRLQITRDTWIQSTGVTDLAAVLAAIQKGKVVLGDAEGFLENEVLIVVRIRFEENGRCDECGVLKQWSVVDLVGYVWRVDTAQSSFDVLGHMTTQTGPFTAFVPDEECGCGDLDGLKSFMEKSLIVNAFVHGTVRTGILHAAKIKFQIVGGCDGKGDDGDGKDDGGGGGQGGGGKGGGDDDDDGKDDGKDDGELKTIVGIVAKVNILKGTITLVDGTVIKLTGDTIIDTAGHVLSLLDLSIKLALGVKVKVEALCLPAVDAFVAVKLKLLLL